MLEHQNKKSKLKNQKSQIKWEKEYLRLKKHKYFINTKDKFK